MKSHINKNALSVERAVRMLAIRAPQSPFTSFGRTALTRLDPASHCTGGSLS
jgi:hypothetical protein